MLHHSLSSLSCHHNRSSRSTPSSGDGTQSPVRSSPTWIKWGLLLCSSIIMLGLYYLISMPASVRRHLKQQMATKSPARFETFFQLTFTLAFIPGIILPFFAGNIVDTIGSRGCLLALSTICCLGQAIAAVGVQRASWTLVLVGRLIYGIGFESLFVANEAFLASVFDHHLGMALGVSSAASFVGYLLSPVLSPIAANEVNVAFSFWLGTMFMAVSVLASLGVYVMTSPKRLNNVKEQRVASIRVLDVESDVCRVPTSKSENEESVPCPQPPQRRFVVSHIRKFCPSFWLLCFSCSVLYGTITSFVGIASGLLLDQYLFIDPPSNCALELTNDCQSGYLAPFGKNAIDRDGTGCIEIDDHTSPVLPRSLNVTGGSLESSLWHHELYVFEALSKSNVDCTDPFWSEACTKEYCDKQDSATREAGILMAIPFIITVLTTFIFGYFGVDKANCHFAMVALSPLLQAVAHGMLAFKVGSCILPLIIIGVGFSIYISAVWPSVSFMVATHSLGTAFGTMTCIQAIGSALFPLAVAGIYNEAGESYVPGTELFFSASSVVLVVVGFLLMYLESAKKTSRVCRMSDSESEAVCRN